MGYSSTTLLNTVFVVGIFGTARAGAPTFWQAPPTSASCTSPVPFADTEDCTSYYQCFRVGAVWQLVHLSCPAGGFWDDVYKACVEGTCGGTTTPPSLSTTPPTDPPTPPPTTPPTKPPTPPSTTPPTQPPTTPEKTTPPSSTMTPTTKPPEVSTPPPPPSGNPCPYEGFFPDPDNCQGYYRCVLIRGRFYRYGFLCPLGSSWSTSFDRCVLGNYCLKKNIRS